MNTQEYKRRLTAILSADVEGYSRLMREDEEATVRTITSYRTAMTHLIEQYRGRVVDSPGDNILAEFTSVVDAVNCAVEIQRELAERNAEIPDNRKMKFRIGVNLGDVLEEGKRIYGDGVNIAARMEGLAEGGGISISGTVYDAIQNKIGLEYEYLGEHQVKNIDKPVRAYRVLSFPGAAAHRVVKAKKAVGRAWRNAIVAIAIVLVAGAALALWNFYGRAPKIEPASKEKMAYPLPDKPSVAVLPFVNMSGDPEQEYFSDGITEEIITALSKVPRLFVIARNSTFTYKGKPVMVQQVAQELGVRYVLEGSVRRTEGRVRVTAQLIDAMTGNHLWGEKYDRNLKDIFAVQDEITFKVVAALQVKLTEGEQALMVAGGTTNFEAYARFLKGIEYAKRFNREGNLLARKMAEEAILLDPNYPRGYRLLATTHWVDVRIGATKSPKESLGKAAELYQKVIVMDPSDSVARALLGIVLTLMRQYEKGIAEAEKAVEVNPNIADSQSMYGLILCFNGRHREALEAIKKAFRLNPSPPDTYWLILIMAYCHTGMYEEAIAAGKEAVRLQPDGLFARLRLALAYALSGRENEARVEVNEVLRINPRYSIEYYRSSTPFKNPADMELEVNALLKAGLPKTPPLPLPDKPSIAVLPFANMSGDPKQEYLCDGITESIITVISKIHNLFVIARNSTFAYKGKAVNIQQVARELGVQYVLEGSVQKSGDRLRITTQLIDSVSGSHLWAQRYDRELKDLFAVQDDITIEILQAMRVKLSEGQQVLRAKRPKNIESAMKAYEAHGYVLVFTPEANDMGRKLAEEVIAMEPDWGEGYYILSQAHMMDVWLGTSKSPKESLDRAIALSEKAVSLDSSLAQAYALIGYLYGMKREHDKSIPYAEKAVEMDPNGADARAWLGNCLRWASRPGEALAQYEMAMRLNPHPPQWYYINLGSIYTMLGRYEESVVQMKRAIALSHNSVSAWSALIVTYGAMGKEDEARAAAAELLKINPKFSAEKYLKTLPYKDDNYPRLAAESFRKAGLK